MRQPAVPLARTSAEGDRLGIEVALKSLPFSPPEHPEPHTDRDLPEVDRLPGYPTHQRASCVGYQETLHHLSGPTNYLATREPAPVIAGRQRTYVTISHSLTRPHVAMRGKLCGAERRTNTVQRGFNSRSHMAVSSDCLTILDGRHAVVWTQNDRAGVLHAFERNRGSSERGRRAGWVNGLSDELELSALVGAERISFGHEVARDGRRISKRSCSVSSRREIGIRPDSRGGSTCASGQRRSCSKNSDFIDHSRSPCWSAKPTHGLRSMSVASITSGGP